MRTPSLLRSTASASRGAWTVIAGATALASAITTSEKVSQPVFDLSSLGLVGLAGDFSGVSEYEYTGQRQLSSYAEDKESLLSQLPNGLFTSLAVTDGEINAMCVHDKGIMIGGSFTSVDGMAANGLVLYNPDTEEVTPMGGNFTGKVNALLCDSDTNTVYVGGKFSHEESTNAISWRDGKWTGFPFLGFSGTVQTIAKTSNNTILFGGKFDGLQKFVAPTTKHVQTVNLVDAAIEVTQASDENGFNDPKSITCTNDTSTQWLLRDGQVGSWTSNFQFEIKPTKLRLINANKDGRGTRTFHVRAFPNSGIMNLTYVDPNTKEKKYCEASCDLAQSDEIQDFEFVNVIGMKALRLDIDSFYGPGGGLSSIQLFQDEIFSYADPRFNEPQCAPAGTRSASESTGTWQSQKSTDTDAYVYADLDPATRAEAKIVFTPHVQERARYAIKMFTPGCQQDGTCSTRGKVQVTGIVTKDGATIPPITYMQTNDFDKYDTVYEGFVDVAEGDYKPQISLQPTTDQPWEVVRIVGQKVQFQLQGKVPTDEEKEEDEGKEDDEADQEEDDTTTGSSGLNGIYEYDPKDTKTPAPSSSAINVAALGLQEGASIQSIIVKDGISYVAGTFAEKDNKFTNFFTIDQDGKVADVRSGGLNGAVGVMLQKDDLIYLAGNFTQTKDESVTTAYVTAYDTKSSEWVQLGGGVNAPVTDLSLVNLSIGGKVKNGVAISGSFTKIQPASGDDKSSDAEGFAIWIPADKKWLSTDDTQLTISGLISGYIKSGDNEIYSGSVSSNTMSSSGMVYLEAQEGVKLKASSFEFGTPTSTNRKRTIPQSQIKSGVSIGHFYENEDEQWTILGGKFIAEGKDGKNIKNLAFIENESQDVTGPENDFTSDSNILTLDVVDDQLWVGGRLEGSDDISGVAIYDMKTRQRAEVQPVGLTTENGTATVYSISKRPESKDIYVAGDFDSAGALECSNLCRYDTTAGEWKLATSSSAPGVIHATKWFNNDQLLVGGNMTLNGTTAYLAIFDATTSAFIAHPGNVKDIPGPVTNLLSIGADGNLERFLSGQSPDGTPFLLLYRPDEDFIVIPNNFTSGSTITDIEVLMLASSAYHSDSADIKQDRVLLVAGSLSLPDFGNASVVTYDGTAWLPFLLTTTENGSPGVVSSFFSLKEQLFDVPKESMKKGYVILISLAIALALVFLLVACGVAASYIRRRREGYVPAPTMGGAEKSTAHMQDRLPPQDLFSHNPQGRGSTPML